MKRAIFYIFIFILSFLLINCSNSSKDNPNNINNIAPGFRLEQFKTCDEINAYLQELAIKRMEKEIDMQIKYIKENGEYACGVYYYDDVAEESVQGEYEEGEPVSDKDASTEVANQEDREHSETNTQVKGVDEADIFKTDGTYVYALINNKFYILNGWPADSSKLLYEVLIEGYPLEMFVTSEKAVIFSSIYSYDTGYAEPAKEGPSEDGSLENSENTKSAELLKDTYSGTKITVIDIKDKDNKPIIEKEFYYQGDYRTSRRIGNNVHVVLSKYNYYYINGLSTWVDPYNNYIDSNGKCDVDGLISAYIDLKKKNKEIISQTNFLETLPKYFEGDKEIDYLTSCQNFYRPQTPDDMNYLSVVSLDLTNEENMQRATSIIANIENAYMSTEKLYVESPYYWYYWYYTSEDDFKDQSAIHEFTLTSDGKGVIYTASGEVDGYILNQFSMDEFNGNLRVATTTNRFSSGVVRAQEGESVAVAKEEPKTMNNNIFVLRANNGILEVIGELRNIQENEEIKSVRFLKDKGFIVTFRQTDPLFTVDLSVPTKPVLAGELKVTGFSTYLHPIDDNHLLGIGQDADEYGNLTGKIQLSIFDVTDFSNPSLMTRLTVGEEWSSSEALYNHKAFTYFASKNLLVIPLSWYNYDGEGDYSYSYSYFTGLKAYKISLEDKKIIEIGTIDHSDFYKVPENKEQYCYVDYYTISPRRSVIIEDFIYSLSNGGVKVNDVRKINIDIAKIPFSIPQEQYAYCYKSYEDDYYYKE